MNVEASRCFPDCDGGQDTSNRKDTLGQILNMLKRLTYSSQCGNTSRSLRSSRSSVWKNEDLVIVLNVWPYPEKDIWVFLLDWGTQEPLDLLQTLIYFYCVMLQSLTQTTQANGMSFYLCQFFLWNQAKALFGKNHLVVVLCIFQFVYAKKKWNQKVLISLPGHKTHKLILDAACPVLLLFRGLGSAPFG